VRALVVADLGFGDSGKGTVIDYLARAEDAVAVVRYNGGAQCGHNVMTEDGRHHEFAQFGAASFVPCVRTYLSRYVLVNPLNLLGEEIGLRRVGVADAFERLAVDEDAVVTTPFHVAANRVRELARGAGRHGSCGLGIGETRSDELRGLALRMGEVLRPGLEARLREIQERKRIELRDEIATVGERAEARTLCDRGEIEACTESYRRVASRVRIVDGSYLGDLLEAGLVLFEGAQGVLLDEWHGFHPHTTWTDTTFENALDLLAPYDVAVTRLGVVRAYVTRHGAGPFVTEDAALTARLPDEHNVANAWQQHFRVGWPDLVALRYALEVAPADVLAVTCLDRVRGIDLQVATAYEYRGSLPLGGYLEPDRIVPGERGDREHRQAITDSIADCVASYRGADRGALVELLEEASGLPVALTSHGPRAGDKRSRLTVDGVRAARRTRRRRPRRQRPGPVRRTSPFSVRTKSCQL